MSEVLQLLAGEGNQSHHNQCSNFLPTKVLDALPPEVTAGVFHTREINLTVPYAAFRQLTPHHTTVPKAFMKSQGIKV